MFVYHLDDKIGLANRQAKPDEGAHVAALALADVCQRGGSPPIRSADTKVRTQNLAGVRTSSLVDGGEPGRYRGGPAVLGRGHKGGDLGGGAVEEVRLNGGAAATSSGVASARSRGLAEPSGGGRG